MRVSTSTSSCTPSGLTAVPLIVQQSFVRKDRNGVPVYTPKESSSGPAAPNLVQRKNSGSGDALMQKYVSSAGDMPKTVPHAHRPTMREGELRRLRREETDRIAGDKRENEKSNVFARLSAGLSIFVSSIFPESKDTVDKSGEEEESESSGKGNRKVYKNAKVQQAADPWQPNMDDAREATLNAVRRYLSIGVGTCLDVG